jgi:hypothetical protein
MSKSLGGFLFIKDGDKYDYCYRESIKSLLEFCDQVSICVVESEDNTVDVVNEMAAVNDKLIVTYVPLTMWEGQKGKFKLAFFQNIAMERLETDYQYLQQADEITNESCYNTIRQAMKTDQEGFLITRINLWGDPFHQLDVPQYRKPCSTEVIRLTKRGCPTYGDGESCNAQAVDWFLKSIRMVHMGYVRKKEIHPSKIREMQGNIFQCGIDEKLNGMEVFDSTKWFGPEDLKPLDEPLPRLIQSWAMERM